jgi:hypothetical protein
MLSLLIREDSFEMNQLLARKESKEDFDFNSVFVKHSGAFPSHIYPCKVLYIGYFLLNLVVFSPQTKRHILKYGF